MPLTHKNVDQRLTPPSKPAARIRRSPDALRENILTGGGRLLVSLGLMERMIAELLSCLLSMDVPADPPAARRPGHGASEPV
ncbi:MAG: hypothetical protein ACO33A_06230 [Hyphomonas sp.]